MVHEWQQLMKLTGGMKITIERVKIADTGIAIEGEFELPELINLASDDQIFLAAFVRCHGSIKQMEKYFGISYPTVKSRLNRLADKMEFVEIESGASDGPDNSEILAQLQRGEIDVAKALKLIKKEDSDVQ